MRTPLSITNYTNSTGTPLKTRNSDEIPKLRLVEAPNSQNENPKKKNKKRFLFPPFHLRNSHTQEPRPVPKTSTATSRSRLFPTPKLEEIDDQPARHDRMEVKRAHAHRRERKAWAHRLRGRDWGRIGMANPFVQPVLLGDDDDELAISQLQSSFSFGFCLLSHCLVCCFPGAHCKYKKIKGNN